MREKSFETSLRTLGFTSDPFLSIENIEELLDNTKVTMIHVYPSEIISFLSDKMNKTQGKTYERDIDFRILDLRRKKGKGYLPYSIEIPATIYKDINTMKKYLQYLVTFEKDSHICIMTTGDNDEIETRIAASFTHYLLVHKKSYVSMLFGGFQSLVIEMEKRKVDFSLYQKERGFFKRLKERLFGTA